MQEFWKKFGELNAGNGFSNVASEVNINPEINSKSVLKLKI